MRTDLCFPGVRSLHPEIGLTPPDREEACVKRHMAEVSNSVVVMATRDKLGTADHFRIRDLSAVDVLIVEDDLEEGALAPFRVAGVTIIR